jgi:hypothetical protein
MSTTSEDLAGLGDTTLATPPVTTDPATSLAEVGSDFGQLLVGVGNAVAATQQKLTEQSADTTSKLANTLVDVIAVQQTGYDDNGNIRSSVPIKEKMPVITFVSPVYYEFPQVRIQGRFVVDEFAAASSSQTSGSSSGYGVGVGMSLQKKAFSLGVSGGYNSTSQSTSTSSQYDQASAVGQMRMFARLTPREDVGIPKPLRVIVGPSLTIVTADLQEGTEADGTPFRTLSVLIQLRNRNGQPIEGKSISIDTEGTPWTFVPDDEDVTNADGNLEILLKRTFPQPPDGAPPVDTTPKSIVVSAILGAVSNRTTVTL